MFDGLSEEEGRELSALLTSLALLKVADLHVEGQVDKDVVKEEGEEDWTSTVVGVSNAIMYLPM